MSDKALVTVRSIADRNLVIRWAHQVPYGTRVSWEPPRRTIEQNDKMWALLTDVARQLPWDGEMLSTHDWKLLFLDALKRESRLVPSLDGSGFVDLNATSSSKLGKPDFCDLITLIEAFGANHGVKFHEPCANLPAQDEPEQSGVAGAADLPAPAIHAGVAQ